MKITPMLQQYLEIKNQHSEAILFYRMGDFYEMFFDDAVEAARILGITLTARGNKGDEEKIPMCGVPYHSASSYLARLIKAGKRVAICEQMEDPAQAKGLVRREVVRVVSPGLVLEEQLLEDKENLYLAAITRHDKLFGLSLLDLSTGEFAAGEFGTTEELLDELNRLNPSEILLPAADELHEGPGDGNPGAGLLLSAELAARLPHCCLTSHPATAFQPPRGRELLLEHFQTTSLAGFGCEHFQAGLGAAGALLAYLQETQKSALSHLEKLRPIEQEHVLLLDEATRRNLELTTSISDGRRDGSLLAALDLTRTPMGARQLKKSLLSPLKDVEAINRRLDAVEQLLTEQELGRQLDEALAAIYDLERLNSRAVLGRANARDLSALGVSLGRLPLIRQLLASQPGLLGQLGQQIDELADLHQLLTSAIRDDAPVGLREGNLIRPGFNAELDELVAMQRDGKQLIAGLEARERERTGIANLKVGYNKVFGYYLEVSRGKLAEVPEDFIRKQTLVNAERFITPELKEFESKVSGAEEKRLELEYRLFCQIREQVAAAGSRIMQSAGCLAMIDLLAALARGAARFNYVRPVVNAGEEIRIVEGRHPVIERNLPPGRFVPNDVHLDQDSKEVMIITGPNMAGKSTVLRQTALIVLMAQMGGFVPAAEAGIGVVDRIFTRVGAMDDLRRGQSTFMVEMNETANILNNATPQSLVILDEIGRGTSTFDGLAIAWAVAEALVQKGGKGVKTMFATHYHELTELAATEPRIHNFHIAVREWNDTIVFLHKLLPGGVSRSYGIQVAALAGVPATVVARAKELLHNIEQGEFTRQGQPRIAVGAQKTAAPGETGKPSQLRLFAEDDPLRRRLEEINPDNLAPLEALKLLYELKQMP
ncbi:DNA mismatch repair protein MutS [Desulfurivibrio alkaliphilus]|uniref:DNA mismatch repair protein MutS n=1 Tax=Desulfurivibrio alkaliphilus (strain DSM 19089 / UNIQEM U267 / AHT2) TaxID=589865 RepID=D6Z4U6_DESAT|nr:DNA mismatch repair protein MutS [Desulfurivibrio alkaliphilus]ADH86571.1 DNA mismatch repair protein MutS [Desulfurivibrio alkaliphilus AHT 2]